MQKESLQNQAQKVMVKIGFLDAKEIYSGKWYDGSLRNSIFSGVYEGKPAVLKMYDDPRVTDEPLQLKKFHELFDSVKPSIITAPELYRYEITSPTSGWFVMEHLPEGKFFPSPMNATERTEFLNVYHAYRSVFPKTATRPLLLHERFRADQFHLANISRWINIAGLQEAQFALDGKPTLLNTPEFVELYTNAEKIIRQEFMQRPMIWCHGHFKAHEVYKTNNGRYYLLDFAHTHLYPEGYEFGFMVWADQFTTLQSKTTMNGLEAEVRNWIAAFEPIATELNIKNFSELARASLIERLMGTITADVVGNVNMPYEERARRMTLLMPLCQQLIDEY
ncbi:MAG: phosphotransferase [Candidatus Kerfeldbacteria bacterium]|nr:phosphotransferase [Candidatus Kerfeldbacteria bacterium]